MSNTPCPPNLLALLSPLPDVAQGREDCPSLQEIFKHEGINNRARRMYHELGDALIEPLSSHFSRLDKTLARREVLAFLRLVRARRSGERLATMAIAPLERSGWKIIQLKGPKNVDVSPLINEIAAIFEGFLNASASPYCI